MKKPKSTICVHEGTQPNDFGGINTAIYTSTAYGYLDTESRLYPRYFNIPNQQAVISKLTALEHGEDGILFSSGMAAVSSVLLTFLSKGDHCIFQHGLYGGTLHFITAEFERFGIEFTVLANNDEKSFSDSIRRNTRVIYIETPSNPLLSIVDLEKVSTFCKQKGLKSIIDNTFASPINQNPLDWGIDIVVHSATKYLGGHSDVCAGAAVSNKQNIDRIRRLSMSLGGSLNALMCYMLERSIKTLAVRVAMQNENATAIAEFLSKHAGVDKVYYPGLLSHPLHDVAKKQMNGFGGMLSFELRGQDTGAFQKKLNLIKPAMSLGGVESTICAPVTTSHRLVTKEQREAEGIKESLLRLSVGIEDANDLIADLNQALKK